MIDQIRLDQRLGIEAVAVLGRDEDALDLDRPLMPVRVDLVAHRHLCLAIRPQVRQHSSLAHLREPMGETMGELDRERHQLLRLIRRVAEHHSLVAGTDPFDRVLLAVLPLERLVDTLGNVRRLLVESHDHTTGLGVEAVLRAGVADVGDGFAHEAWDIDVGRRRDLACDHDEPRRDQRLAGDPTVGVVGEDCVEDGIGKLVGDLVRVALCDGLGAEAERAGTHRRYPTNHDRRHSDVGSRCMRVPTSSSSGTPSRTEHTASVIGISTPRL